MSSYEEHSTVFTDEEFEGKHGETDKGAGKTASDAEAADSHNNKSGGSPPKIESAVALLLRKFAEPKWAIKGLLSEGATVFAGAPKVGKSWCALGIAIDVATGGSALGSFPVTQGDVLYLALEDGDRRMHDRLKQVLTDKPAPEKLQFAYTWPRLDDGGLKAIEEWLKSHKDARLIVVDTLKRVRPIERRGGRLYDGDYDAVAPLNDLAQRYHVCIFIVHHTNKRTDAEDWFDSLSGSLGLTGAVDSAMLLSRKRNVNDGKLQAAGRDIEDKEFELRWQKDRFKWEMIGNALTDLAQKIVAWLIEAGDTGLSRTDINKKNGGRSDGVEDALTELETVGRAKNLLKAQVGRAQQWVAVVGK